MGATITTGHAIKMTLGGLVLFGLGAATVYFLVAPTPGETSAEISASIAQEQTTSEAISPSSAAVDSAPVAITTESFYEAAEARREQLLIDKEEADRIAKLKAIKERSVECKFWKQQQKTSSAAAKIEEKIDEHCNLPSSSSASESNSADTSSAASTNTPTQ